MEMCNLVRSAFTTGTFPPQLVETLVVPMPKVDNPTSMKEVRPISLCNMLFKIISKVLVHRLCPSWNLLLALFKAASFPIERPVIMQS